MDENKMLGERYRGVKANYIPIQSKLAIIEALIEFGPLSRSDLADLIGLSRSALTELSQELIALGLMHG